MKIDDSLEQILDEIGILPKERTKVSILLLKIMAVPFIAVCVLSTVIFFFIGKNWGANITIIRAFVLVSIVVVILLFSKESLTWRIISITIATVFIGIDMMAQLAGWYAQNTSLANSLQYDFLSHLLMGLIIAITLTNIIYSKFEKKIIWVIVISVILAILWELWEALVYYIAVASLGHVKDFTYNPINSIWDILAHLLGTAAGVFAFTLYKYVNCPSEYREGIVCRLT